MLETATYAEQDLFSNRWAINSTMKIHDVHLRIGYLQVNNKSKTEHKHQILSAFLTKSQR